MFISVYIYPFPSLLLLLLLFYLLSFLLLFLEGCVFAVLRGIKVFAVQVFLYPSFDHHWFTFRLLVDFAYLLIKFRVLEFHFHGPEYYCDKEVNYFYVLLYWEGFYLAWVLFLWRFSSSLLELMYYCRPIGLHCRHSGEKINFYNNRDVSTRIFAEILGCVFQVLVEADIILEIWCILNELCLKAYLRIFEAKSLGLAERAFEFLICLCTFDHTHVYYPPLLDCSNNPFPQLKKRILEAFFEGVPPIHPILFLFFVVAVF